MARVWFGDGGRRAAAATAGATGLALLATVMASGGASDRASAAAPSARADGGKPLPRIAVVNGRFARGPSNRPFAPRGFNYIRLRPRWHGTFAPKRYDAKRAEAMLEDVHSSGFNTVRVFIDPDGREGIAASASGEGFSKAYVANFLDFLRRAARHEVYVIPSLLYLPPCKRYDRIVGRQRRRFSVGNEVYFDEKYVRAKAQFVADFVAAIKQHDAALLPAVLAYELDNETHFSTRARPFSLDKGTVVGPDGKTYDCSSDEAMQRLADAAVVRWADACVAAARKVDPEAMVSVNVFTFAAVGRRGPGAVRAADSTDARLPARPLALARTKLAYLDIHFYPFDESTLDRDLKSIEFDELRKACKAAGKPLIMGEFGAFKKPYPTLRAAGEAMRRHLRRAKAIGFQGWLYWTYDTDEQSYLWNAKSGRGEILDVLRGE